jgi:RHS repeat-associated protein
VKSLAPSETPNARLFIVAVALAATRALRTAPKAFARMPKRLQGFLLLFFFLFGSSLHAQVGGGNPTGPSGIFNGNLENTGVDPWTANARRSITDISVAGVVGEYPLALVRTANSRAPSTTEVFGSSGGWNHNYNWILEDSPHKNNANYPVQYTVEFPDGRLETFRAVTWDTAYRVRPGPSTPAQSTSAGVRERFLPIHQENNDLYADLILPDGGKVEFHAALRTDAQGKYYYKYRLTAIYDPYGLKTTIDSALTPNQALRRITRVTEPGGRYLQFSYVTNNGPRIKEVQEFIGGFGRRKVQYSYIYCNGCSLGSVVYYGNLAWTAKYQYTGANIGDGDTPLLLKTCEDPMYPGPMKRISYEYKTGANADGTEAVYGQVWKVRYWDGISGPDSGATVSTLTVGGQAPNASEKRKEIRGDNKERTFIYNGAGVGGYLAWASDFSDRYASQGYDSKKYINAVTDRRGNKTDYTNDPVTGNVTQIKFPFTQGDTPGQNQQPTVNYSYTNNYYLYTVQGENGFTTTINRYGDNRVQSVVYPDGGWESFTYDSAHLYQVSTHRMSTTGTESWAYDGLHRLQYYSDAYHNNNNAPSTRYVYDMLGRVNGITDALNHSTNYEYNDRGQLTVTTLPADPVDGIRHTITNAYNPNGDGTLVSVTDQLGHVTSYEYDDYRRLTKVTPPARGDGTGTHPAKFYYDVNGNTNDYRYTDSNVTWTVLPSGKKTKTLYDDNRRKTSVTVAPGVLGQEATTNYAPDAMGNVTQLKDPMGHRTDTVYDERNRPWKITEPGNRLTQFTYDTAGRQKIVQRPNGQVTTFGDFDEMNRPRQVTATDAGTTKYTYHPGSGLVYTMQDPRMVALGRDPDPWVGYVYTYLYDGMGRKSMVGYPPPDPGVPRTFEAYTYDDAGRLWTFTNRAGKVQTFDYDALNRLRDFYWTNSAAPRVDFAYDAASRLTDINNANATISRLYWDDDSLRRETETPTAGLARSVDYFYNEDGNRDRLQMPGYTFKYVYTGRNQLQYLNDNGTGAHLAYYDYDLDGKLTLRTAYTSPQSTSTYEYDGRDRLTRITHALNGTNRTFSYGYYDDSNNRKWTKRESGYGDVFGYDRNDQVTAVFLDRQNPDHTEPGDQTIFYDGSGNRTRFEPYDWTETYTINNLNQYPLRNTTGRDAPDQRPTPTPRPRPSPPPRPTPPGQQAAVYDSNGNMTNGFDGSIYEYDAQNRLLSASAPGRSAMSFKYDGLNRQVSRTVSGTTTLSVWDGWDLVEEYHGNGVVDARYLHGPTGLVKNLAVNRYYYQDGSANTSHLADSTGHLLEGYLYDLQGSPSFLDANGIDRNPNQSAFNVRHLFTGQQWYKEIGLYDLRNRFYSPDIGRFVQPDPIGFGGDATNLYRYTGNNPVTRSDPSGETVYIAQKPVISFGNFATGVIALNHTYLVVSPSNLASFPGAARVTGSGELTISGQPSGALGSGYLNGTINSDIYSPRNDMTLVPPPAGISDAAFDYSVYDAATSYPDDTYKYVAIPELSPLGGYNSNGYLARVLNGAGVNGQQIVNSLPGWQPGSGYPPGGGSWSYQNDKGEVIVVGTDPHSPWGNLATTPTMNWAGGRAGQPFGGSSWRISFGVNLPSSIFGADNWYSGLNPMANVGSTYGEGFRGMYNFP